MKGRAFLLLTLFLLRPAIAYDQHSTHPSLTYEMAQFFNTKNLNLNYYLLPKEIDWLKKGSVEEDEPARWINHFYDPVHNVGWSGKHLGNLSVEEGYQLGGDIAPRHSIASIDWVTNQEYQAAYGRQYGNQTWQKAIKSYLDGDKKAAFIALGHVLHLVEDATVPDHVRDDSHPGIEGDPGSPYEVYSKVQTDVGELQTAENLLRTNVDFKKLKTINQAIKDLAIYTNSNFFSEDTINKDDFKDPFQTATIESVKIGTVINNYLTKDKIFLAKVDQNDLIAGRSKYTTSDGIFVLPSYRDHLFPEAVLTGASVINLFFQEVEKYKQNPSALEPIVPDTNDPFLVALQQFPKREVLKVCGAVSEAVCKDAGNALAVAGSAVSGAFNNVVGSIKTVLGLDTQPIAQNNITPKPMVDIPVSVAASKPEPITVADSKAVTHSAPTGAKILVSPKVSADSAVLGIKISAPDIVQIFVPPSPFVQSVPAQAVYGGGVQGFSQLPNLFGLIPVSQVAFAPSIPNSEPTVPPPPTSTIFITTTIPEVVVSSTPPSTPEIIIDLAPPLVPVLTIINQSGVSSTNILVRMASTDILSPPVFFDLQVSTSTSNWQYIVTSTVSSTANFVGIRGQSYYFRARAADAVGNTSNWSETSAPTFVNWSGEVVINEIAWAGTAADASTNEWFELYNNTAAGIDLSNWKIFISGKELSISKINNNIIPARGYYLFERSSDNTIIEIPADVIFNGAISNSGEKIELIKPNGEKADEVNASAGWFAGSSVTYKSMERISSLINGSESANWQSNQGLRENGRTFNGGPIYGSPKRSNFGFINLNFDQIDTVRTLTAANNPYLLQYYSIPAGRTLIIEPGVIIKSYFNNSKIDVYGTLIASGNASNKIIFTSGRDVSLDNTTGNVVIGSWPGPSSTAQDWQGMWFRPGSVGNLNNIEFRYAGKGFVVPPFALPVSQAVRVDNAMVTISGSVFSDNGPTTLFSKNASTTITQSNFNKGDRAIESENSSLTISDSVFGNYTNSYGPLFIKDTWPALQRVSYQNNTVNMPYLEAVTIANQNADIGESENYLVNILAVSSTGSLRINPGASVYIPLYGIIEVRGTLQALGSAEKPISFLPYPASVNWGNIRFTKSTSTLNFVQFKQGNRLNGRPESLNGMILATDSNLTITNSNLWDSEANSVQSNNSILKISNTTIGATIKNVNTKGIKAPTGMLTLDTVSFNNLSLGLESGSSGALQLIVDIKNMSSSSFSNVDFFWQPSNLWSFPPVPLAI